MSLIAELTRLQETRGYLRAEDLQELAAGLGLPTYRLQEVASFYPHFRTEAPAPVEIAVCQDISCHLAAPGLCRRLREELGQERDVVVRESSCLGRCERAPAALINGVPVGATRPEHLVALARNPEELPKQAPASEGKAWKIDVYRTVDELEPYAVYRSLRDETEGSAPESIVRDLTASGLRGMGGAGFPTGRKWEIVRSQPESPRYVICNADESEPGTFKDRVILAELPRLVIEGMCLAALVVGAREGWIYLRHEYEMEREALETALGDARERGVLGEAFDIEIFVSPGGYILGEETALLEAMEDRRGEPRTKPPYPGEKGLFSKPTVINNVETLAMVPAILHHGPEWWSGLGVRGHSGLKFISVSGHVESPGVYEIPMGTTVAELIEMAGGVSGGRSLKAFAPGGASSDFLPADRADVEIDFDSLQDAGSMLGSGALIVLAEGTDMIDAAANVVRFFRNESCGKCVPCRVGTQKVVALLEDVLAGRGDGALRAALPRLEETLAETSICGLGQVALNPLVSALRYWGDELDRHLNRSDGSPEGSG